MHTCGWAGRRPAALRGYRKRAVVSCADRIIFAYRFTTPCNKCEEHRACRDGERNATERDGEEECRRRNGDEERREARAREVDPCRCGAHWKRGHADLAWTSASEAEEDPRVESRDDEEDDDREELDQRAPVRGDERSKERDDPLKERAERVQCVPLGFGVHCVDEHRGHGAHRHAKCNQHECASRITREDKVERANDDEEESKGKGVSHAFIVAATAKPAGSRR